MAFTPGQLTGLTLQWLPTKAQSAMDCRDFSGLVVTDAQDYLFVDHVAVHNLGDIEYIMGCWVLVDEDEPDSQHIMGMWNANTNNRQQRVIYNETIPLHFDSTVSPDGTQRNDLIMKPTGTFSLGTWYYVQTSHSALDDERIIGYDNANKNTQAYAEGVFDQAGESANQLAPFVIGANGRKSGGVILPRKPLDGRVSRAFTLKPTVSASSIFDEVATIMYNAGLGRTWDEVDRTLTSAQKTNWGWNSTASTFYDLNEDTDAVAPNKFGDANADLAAAGTVPRIIGMRGSVADGEAVSEVRQTEAAHDYQQNTRANQPTWYQRRLAADPSVAFNGTSDELVYTAANPYSSAQGLIAITFSIDATGGSERVLFSSSNDAKTNEYFRIAINTAGKIVLQVRDVGAFNNEIRFDNLIVTAGATHALIVSSAGVGNPYLAYLDGDLSAPTKTVVNGTDTGEWIDLVPDRDNAVVGSLKLSTGSTEHFNGSISSIIIATDVNTSLLDDLFTWMRANAMSSKWTFAPGTFWPNTFASGTFRGFGVDRALTMVVSDESLMEPVDISLETLIEPLSISSETLDNV